MEFRLEHVGDNRRAVDVHLNGEAKDKAIVSKVGYILDLFSAQSINVVQSPNKEGHMRHELAPDVRESVLREFLLTQGAVEVDAIDNESKTTY